MKRSKLKITKMKRERTRELSEGIRIAKTSIKVGSLEIGHRQEPLLRFLLKIFHKTAKKWPKNATFLPKLAIFEHFGQKSNAQNSQNLIFVKIFSPKLKF